MLKEKQEMRVKREQKRQRQAEKEFQKRIKAQKLIDSEISFKRWKMQKEKQQEEELIINKIQQEKEKQHLVDKAYRRKRGEVLLAYSKLQSWNQKVNKLDSRPKTARVTRKKRQQ